MNKFIGVGLLAASVGVQAADSNFYLGAGFSQLELKVNESEAVDGPLLSDKQNGYALFGGYRVNPYVAFELGYAKHSDFEDEVYVSAGPMLPAFFIADIEADITQKYVDVLVSYPVMDAFSVYGLVGYLDAKSDVRVRLDAGEVSESGSENDVRYGIGVRAEIADNWYSRLQWTTAEIDDVELDSIRLSVEYSF